MDYPKYFNPKRSLQLFGLSQDRSLEECGNIAAAVASDVISKIGASVSAETIAKFKK